MSVSLRRVAVGSVVSLGLAAALSMGAATAASASEGGQVIIRDNGQACVAVWKNADGSYTDYKYQNFPK